MSDKYSDMIHLPHKQSTTRKHMSVYDRAAQFAPFAALTGYDSAINETGRLTEERRQLSETDAELLNMRFNYLAEHIDEQPEITVTYFLPDERKAGGAYIEHTGCVKRIEDYERLLIFTDGKEIFMDDIRQIESTIFPDGDID